jgi:hypothetical protein
MLTSGIRVAAGQMKGGELAVGAGRGERSPRRRKDRSRRPATAALHLLELERDRLEPG